MKRLLFLILILTLTNLCFGREFGWKIINLKKTMTNERNIYTGKVIWRKNNQPAKVRIMLIGTSSSMPYDEIITSYYGKFRLSTPKEVTPLFLIQPFNKRTLLIPPNK